MINPQFSKSRTVVLPVSGEITHFFSHGYQSWSLATWISVAEELPIPYPTLLHPLQFHPDTAKQRYRVGHWLGAVRSSTGEVTFLGGLSTDCLIQWDGSALIGEYSGSVADGCQWFTTTGDEKACFDGYAQALKTKFAGTLPIPRQSMRAWCSWYSYYAAITEKNLSRTITQLATLPFDIIQIDDGWQSDIGDWTENDKFPSGLKKLTDQINTAGKQAGLWLAPLIASKSSTLFNQHPDWFIRDAKGGFVSAGFNWSQPLFGLDLTHPSAVSWLAQTLKHVESLGFTYLKLDFLYGSALPGKRLAAISGEEAYREGLTKALSVLDPQTFVLFCGAPIIPSLGLCHGLRIGPDVANLWESPRDSLLLANPATPGVRNALRTCAHRLWLGNILRLDPDVVYFATRDHSLTPQQAQALKDLATLCDFKATSDLPDHLTPAEFSDLSAYFTTSQPQNNLLHYHKQNPNLLDVPTQPIGVALLLRELLGALGNQPVALKILGYLEKRQLQKKFPDK